MRDIRTADGSAAARLAIGRGRVLSWSLALLPAALLVQHLE